MNILGIDVEDWYCDLDIRCWGTFEDRIVESTNRVLAMLEHTNNHATFFILGYVAERFPELINRINSCGHEIATHGYDHTPLTKQTPKQFESDLLKSIAILVAITDKAVLGYRAPQFTIVKKTSWAIGILHKHGLKYDSSVFPTKTHLYGVPRAPLFPYHISASNIEIDAPGEQFLEIPLSVYRLPFGVNLPIAGGFYLRLLPYVFIKHAIGKINKVGQPAICYLHPWELDTEQPRIRELSWYHYYRLASAEAKFERLLKDFRFVSVREYFNLCLRK